MAKINNQAVLQKLMDELKLYPGIDVIPTELAEKILPVYQINTEVIEVSPKPANVVRSVELIGAGGAVVMYTVPATGKFYLTNVALSSGIDTSGTLRNAYVSVVIDSVIVDIVTIGLTGSALTTAVNQTISLNLQNPILLDPGSEIKLDRDNAGMESVASIVGYTSD